MPFNVLRITVSGQDTPRAAALDVLTGDVRLAFDHDRILRDAVRITP